MLFSDFGVLNLNLLSLINAPLHTKPDKQAVRVIDQFSSIYGKSGSTTAKLGSVRVVLTLEDFGRIQTETTQLPTPNQTPQKHHQQSSSNHKHHHHQHQLNEQEIPTHDKPHKQKSHSTKEQQDSRKPAWGVGAKDSTAQKRAKEYGQNVSKSRRGSIAESEQSAATTATYATAATADSAYFDESSHPGNVAVSDPRSTAEYQLAWELEMWRRAEQSRLQVKWQEEEAKRMTQLEGEWKKQELQRETQLAIRQKEITALEKKLQSALFEVQQQERALKLKESDITARASTVASEIATARADAENVIRRIKEQQLHKDNMHKRVVTDMQTQNEQLKGQINSLNAKLQAAEQEFAKYKAKVTKSTVSA